MKDQVRHQFSEAQKKHQKGDLHGAVRIYDVILQKNGGHFLARIYRALAFQQLGRSHASKSDLLTAAGSKKTRSVVEYMLLGILFRGHRMVQDAENAFKLGLELDPTNGPLLSNYAVLLMQMGRLEDAEKIFIKAAQELVEDPAPNLNLARIYISTQRYELAEEALARVKDIDAGHPDFLICSGMLAKQDADFSTASRFYTAALKKLPSSRVAWQELRGIPPEFVNLHQLNDLSLLLAKLNISSAATLAAAVGTCRNNLAWAALDQLEEQLSTSLERGVDEPVSGSAVFDLLAAQISQKAHLQAASSCWRARCFGCERRPIPVEPMSGRKLRIAYLSSDFRAHAIGTLVAGVIEQHDHTDFEWYAYNNSVDDNSDLRKRFREAFDRWINVYNMNDSELVDRVRSDNIDVIVDLNGITGATRVLAFAQGIAPIQVTWLGMPGSAGAGEAIDYQIVDSTVVDEKNEDGFHEKLVFLPRSYVPRDPYSDVVKAVLGRTEHNLPEEAVVYCSFNQPYKFSPETIGAWVRILAAVEGSVLWLMGRNKMIEERFLELLDKEGISPERVIYAQPLPRASHLARLQLADVMLDNWPYNAGTTCTDALISGVPVISLSGNTFVSRVGSSILNSVQLGDFTALTVDDYVEKAIKIGNDREHRETLKNTIKERFLTSPVADSTGTARLLELAYKAMIARAIDGMPPEHLYVYDNGEVKFSQSIIS